jgi:two-component system, OmpR family, response regulator
MANILVVDDEPDTLKLVTLILSRAGHSVLPVSSGTDALTQVANRRPDIILLDVMLPDTDGFSVAQKIKTQLEDPPPIIFFSARSSPEDQVLGRTLGERYLVKPVRLTTLLEIVQQVLNEQLK